MRNRGWIIGAAALAIVVAGGTVAAGLYMQAHQSEPTADERVSSCVDQAMQRMDGVDDAELVAATRSKVRAACEERVG